jgi:hypothetical protein
VELARGQLAHSTRYMAGAWRWPETNVRRFLATLKTGAMIGAETGAGITIITICNYDLYQTGACESGAPDGAEIGAKVARDRRRKEELNNLIKETTPPSPRSKTPGEPEGFSVWYGIFPRKKKRKDAARAFAKLMVSGEITLPELIERTRAFAAYWAKQPRDRLGFCPYPSSWLNSGEYLDEPEAADGAAEGPKIEAPIRNPNSFTESDWRDRLAPFRATGQWAPDHWGPPPGAEGCLVPVHLQQAASGATESGRG